MKFIDLTGQIFGRLTVVSLHSKEPRPRWNCICQCGEMSIVLACNLRAGDQQSCGCLRRVSRLKHGESHKTKENRAWRKLKERCFTKSCKKYPDYGGRGITVCDRWINSYENFLDDMGRAPSPNHSIDRKDNDGNYEPANCHWATIREQANNKRNNRLILFKGEIKTISQWAEILKINKGTIRGRIYNGWTDHEALATPGKPLKLPA